MITFICYEKCSTCKKAEKFLNDNNIKYDKRDIKKDNPSKEELDKFIKLSKLDVKSFFNTSGLIYRKLNLKDKLKDMSYDDKLSLLSGDGMLVKRPILVLDDKILVGFNEKLWNDLIK